MRVTAFYDHGKLRLPAQLRLQRDSFPVVLELPDEALVEASLGGGHGSIADDLNAILGKYRRGHLPQTVADDKAAWHQYLAEKHS